MIHHLGIENVRRGQAQLSLLGLEQNGWPGPIVGYHAHNPLQFGAERRMGEGLEHVIKGMNRVTLDSIPAEAGHKHDKHPLIHLPHPSGYFHSQHIGYLDIQHQYIRAAVVLLQ